MHLKTLAEMNYPPPPPTSTQSRSQKKLIAIIAIIIIAVAAVSIVAFVATNPTSPKPSASPTSSPTPGQSASPGTSTNPSTSPTSSTTPSPSSSTSQTASPSTTPTGQSFASFRAGAWANYTMKDYDETGAVSEQSLMSYAIGEENYNGAACWLLKTEVQMNDASDITIMKMTYWINKNTNEGTHMRTQIFTNGELIFENEKDITPSDADYELPTGVDPTTIVGQETITVPAGTFNCQKATTTSTYSGTTSVSNVWINSDIPVMGWVKEQTTQNGVLSSVIELVAYGA